MKKKKNDLIIKYISKRNIELFLLKIVDSDVILYSVPILDLQYMNCNIIGNRMLNYIFFLFFLENCGLIHSIFIKNEY